MKGIFNLDSPFISFLSRLADLMILNLWTLICCIPIVTIGTSLTSMYYVLLRLRNEEIDSVTRDFFHSFKMNFKQSTLMWAMYLLAIVVLWEDYYLMYVVGSQTLLRLRYAVYIATALVLVSITWSFVQLSRYHNSIRRIILNSFRIGFAHFIRTLAMALLTLMPIVVVALYPPAIPIMLVMGVSLPGYLQTMLFSPVLKKLEQPDNDVKTDTEETTQQS